MCYLLGETEPSCTMLIYETSISSNPVSFFVDVLFQFDEYRLCTVAVNGHILIGNMADSRHDQHQENRANVLVHLFLMDLHEQCCNDSVNWSNSNPNCLVRRKYAWGDRSNVETICHVCFMQLSEIYYESLSVGWQWQGQGQGQGKWNLAVLLFGQTFIANI